jgi:membrane protease YdiL (CAAX protease family)
MPTVRQAVASCSDLLHRWLPPARRRLVLWSGREIVAAVFLTSIFWPAFGMEVLDKSGFFHYCYGDDVLKTLKEASKPDATPGQKRLGELALARLNLWLPILILPFQVASLPLLFYFGSGSRPYQMGLTCQRGWQNVGLGILGAVILTPVVVGVNLLVNTIFQNYTEVVVEEHPFMRQVGAMQPSEYVALFCAVVVAAPVLEELMVRGILQQWFATRRWGGHLAMVSALLFALGKRQDDFKAAWRGEGELWHALLPALFVVAMVPGYLVVWKSSRTSVGPAVFGSALLFGALHSAVWPSPVALFVFGLFQGWLFQRTQSLVGPVVVHALFNSAGYLLIVWR